ncbi:pilus (MSHA type) biogenesis protein MshL [Sulfuricurvum sp.]|uniref:pilus (MSHA type) biogenesis protein MshL n=1 Tax=Sulfuricurvum sp. TaxID=2025608 RepID=UPI0026026B8E|nr:pilus (MSHA type) biogenesis protein MshL [Sulfuricurvum sp.]MDD2266457.1 pilus (MSHA type) biogenesis protein MshL [Sulfuricurvum sp.]MDD2782665.1 pilus (MSHA type) biogenesis protein MshL [Sulfuricurvum sp.]
MTSVIKHHARAFMLSVATAALLTPTVQADCKYELFNISSAKGTTVGEFVDQLSDECGMSLIVTDEQAEEILKKPMNKTFLKDLTINEVLDLIIKENNLQYTLQNNILRVSYLTTKTYNIDYIISQRKGTGSANITLSSNTSTSSTPSTSSSGATSTSSNVGGNSASSQSGIKITSSDEVQFWETLDKDIESVLNRPEDTYKATIPLINKSSGLITVTATGPQLKRLDTYIDDLQKKMQTQVLIDVKMYSVVFSDASSTGIDWSQLYALQNIGLGFNTYNTKNIGDFSGTAKNNIIVDNTTVTAGAVPRNIGTIFQLGAQGSLTEVIKFLKTQGDVYSISNPKILTLNNQPALITSGTELFYKTKNTSTLAGGTTGTQATTEVVSSVFSGVLLDITPEISSDGSITLRINPSISETASTVSIDNAARTMPPDLSRRQMSSVITVKDGNRVILGGLINTKNVNDSNKVPLLGDIPFLGYLFKREGITKKTEEIVIIIEPHIIKKEKDTLSLGDLGYTRLGTKIEEAKQESK